MTVPTRIVIAGAAGRMGRILIRAVAEADSLQLVAALGVRGRSYVGEDAGELSGCGPLNVSISTDARAALAGADAILDFSSPRFTVQLSCLAAEMKVAHVIGTTGFSGEEQNAITAAARRTVVIKSGNMSLGVTLLASFVRQAAKALPNFDIEILEMHHRNKVDAPSGTALLLGAAAAGARGFGLEDSQIRGRDGRTGIRAEGAIGFASLRGGTVVGEHHAIFAGPDERISLSHAAENRMIFARGALAAAKWAQGKAAGLYSMEDVLGLA